MSGKVVSTIGFERRFNPALRPRTQADFVQFILETLPPKPDHFADIVAANREEGG
ncbi:hypothetical protein [Sulfobacillus harzensis]|uniref:hypothetical protein n=1 Tax=Sulfobacillus harzensis TaxID=2729629 RepID=UPI001A9B47A9|nr:hypothetical protein [Sulfobacillus harzensis]